MACREFCFGVRGYCHARALLYSRYQENQFIKLYCICNSVVIIGVNCNTCKQNMNLYNYPTAKAFWPCFRWRCHCMCFLKGLKAEGRIMKIYNDCILCRGKRFGLQRNACFSCCGWPVLCWVSCARIPWQRAYWYI